MRLYVGVRVSPLHFSSNMCYTCSIHALVLTAGCWRFLHKSPLLSNNAGLWALTAMQIPHRARVRETI